MATTSLSAAFEAAIAKAHDFVRQARPGSQGLADLQAGNRKTARALERIPSSGSTRISRVQASHLIAILYREFNRVGVADESVKLKEQDSATSHSSAGRWVKEHHRFLIRLLHQ